MKITQIPETLKDRDQWVLWKTVSRGGQMTKVPSQANGEAASSTNAATWTTFDEAVVAYRSGGDKFSGVGFVFAHDDDLCGIDLDGCRDAQTGIVSDWAKAWVLAFDSYAEVSPSGTGVKIFVFARKPTWCGCKVAVNADAVAGDKKPGIEIYDQGRYFAVTGQRLKGMPAEPQDRQTVVEQFCEAFFERPAVAPVQETRDFGSDEAILDRARKYISVMEPAVSGSSGHNRTFSVACVLMKGFGLTKEQGMALLREWNSTHCTPPWSDKELAHKIDSAMKASGETNYLRLARPISWDRIERPTYTEPKAEHVESTYRVTTLSHATMDYLDKLRKGNGGLIELGIPDLDYALGGGVEPGEMVILAALPSHGKSLVAMQMIHHVTSNGLPAVMISEEMSALMLGKRAIQFATDVNQEYWRTHEDAVMQQLAEHFGVREECYIVEDSVSSERAADAIREHVAKYDCKVAVVDYAQFLRSKGKDSFEQVTNTSMIMKQVAKETGVVLLLLCQLNREIQKRNTFLPQMSDLRGSGQLEQDADVIVFLCWPHKISPEKHKPGLYQLFIKKNRNRETNAFSVECNFQPRRQMLLPSKPVASEKYDFT